MTEIASRAKREGWAYQKTFHALKDAGVSRYRTMVSNQETTYVGNEETCVVPPASDSKSHQIAKPFNGRAVQEAIIRHQENQTPYNDFMEELANAGVEFCEVYTDTGAIHYTTGNPLESFVQPVSDVWD